MPVYLQYIYKLTSLKITWSDRHGSASIHLRFDVFALLLSRLVRSDDFGFSLAIVPVVSFMTRS